MTVDDVSACLLAVGAGDRETAVRRARSAADGSSAGRLGAALLRFLEGGRPDVYADPQAFERFIDGGGNVALYRAAHTALAAGHERDRPASVLDIGCGDGRLTTAAIGPGLARLDLVEPSADLLAAARARLADHDVSVVAHGCTAQELVAAVSSGHDPSWPERWDSAQSTFALHTVPPEDRQTVLRLLARRVRRLLVVEFDVPGFADRSAEHARYAAERYAAGVDEYRDDELVVDGFLMPVLVGQFDPARPRHTWEQPVAQWIADLRRAGFSDVRHQRVSDYWWATAHLIEATAG